jgi:hypothetical protein
VILTIFVLNFLQERREEARRIRDLQEQLVREAASSVNATARTAVDTMRKRRWLGRKNMYNFPDDIAALLMNEELFNADLSYADLRYVDLSNSYMFEAKLNGAKLRRASLHSVNLVIAQLIAANLYEAQLTNANLDSADCRYANLCKADLRGANLKSADLTDALIDRKTRFDETSILPDGTTWSPGRDLREFGMETRPIRQRKFERIGTGEPIMTFTFEDGTIRRWQWGGAGWLDDRDGNPIEGNELPATRPPMESPHRPAHRPVRGAVRGKSSYPSLLDQPPPTR